ncbi:MAG: hypothetical protein ABFE13_26040 [Phycisphaerales bacterium]
MTLSDRMSRRTEMGAVLLVLLGLVAGLRGGETTLSPPKRQPDAMKTFSFPSDRWIGNLFLEPESGPGWDPKGVRLFGEWEFLSPAQGDVPAPQGRSVVLSVSLALSPREVAGLQAQNPQMYQRLIADRVLERPSDLSGLSLLDPNDLFRLSVGSPAYKRTGAHPALFEPISRLTGLEIVSLHCSGITDAGMEHLRPLRSLKALELTQFPIGIRGLAVLKDLPALEHLDLNVGVTDAGLKEVAQVSGLRSLRLTHGNIWGPGLAELAKLPHLEQLCIEDDISDRHIQYLEGLTRLKALAFWYVGDTLTDASLASIAKLKNLEELYFVMSNPRFTPAGVAQLKKLPNFRKVDFAHTWVRPEGAQYGDEVARQLAAFPSLESVAGLAYLSADGLKAMATIRNLKCLDVTLTDRGLGYSGPTGLSHLAGLGSLEELRIHSGDALPDADLAALESLSHLKELLIAGFNPANPGISERGLASIGKLRQLERLNLMTNVTRSGLNHLNGLSNLQQLKVSMAGDAFGTAPADEVTLDLAGLKKMKDMNLTGLPLRDRDLAFLKHLSSLEKLMIQPSSPLAGESLRHLTGLPVLDSLRIYRLANCTGEELARLDRFPKLRTVTLSGDITDAALVSWMGPPCLESLYVFTDAPIRKETVDDLAARLPLLEYVHINELTEWQRQSGKAQERPAVSPPRTNRQSPTKDRRRRR